MMIRFCWDNSERMCSHFITNLKIRMDGIITKIEHDTIGLTKAT